MSYGEYQKKIQAAKKCCKCGENKETESIEQDWLFLMNLSTIMYLNGQIPEDLHHEMTERLMTFKGYAFGYCRDYCKLPRRKG